MIGILSFSEMKPFGEPGVESNYIMDALHILVKQQSVLICSLLILQGCSPADRKWPGSARCRGAVQVYTADNLHLHFH